MPLPYDQAFSAEAPSPQPRPRSSSSASSSSSFTSFYDHLHAGGGAASGSGARRWGDNGVIRQESQERRSSRVLEFISSVMRSPLLLRSSPAQGTGSYGALTVMDTPTGEVSRSPTNHERSNDNSEDNTNKSRRRNSVASGNSNMRLGKMKSAASLRRKSEASESRKGVYFDELWEGNADDNGEGSSKRRRRRRSSSAVAVDDESVSLKVDDSDEEINPHENSPYAQVRASVSPTDDTSLSVNTPRMWTLSILFSILGSSTNLFFSLRYPSVSITPVIALLLAHPLGLLWDQLFPRSIPPGGGKIRRLRRWLSTGRWNMKEHACVYISSNVSFGFAFATDVIVTQTHFYKQPQPVTYQLLLTLSTQILGYTFAGLTRQWLVYPAAMVWPATLMSTAMFSTLHDSEKREETVKGWERWGRWRFFLAVFVAAFVWYFVPGFLMTSLSYFNVVTWIWPMSVVVASLFGVSSGVGMFPVTFDWAQISYIGSPLMTPFWAATNVVAGLVLVMWLVAPYLYYTNSFFSAYMPILSSNVYDNMGKIYDVSKILTPNHLFDEKAYKDYSKIFLPITYVLSYGLQFAALTALLTHTLVWHGRDILNQGKKAFRKRSGWNVEYTRMRASSVTSASADRPLTAKKTLTDDEWATIVGEEDVHMRLMKKYDEAPASWYLSVFAVSIVVGIFVVEYYPVYLPWYGLVLALLLCGIFFVPIGIVMAITNQQSSIFLICQLICGEIFPGRPVANMVFVTYGYITSTQGLKFASDLKLGHYMKIPPRLLFTLQLTATLIASTTQIGVLNWMFSNIPGICTPSAMNGFTCPIARVHFNGSILWGVVGPRRFFGPGELYRPLVYAFLIGLFAPLIVWIIARRKHKSSIWRMINLPVLFGSLSWIPPATGLNFSSWAIVCWTFNSYIKRRNNGWWRKYTMTLSAALDSGLAVGLCVVFFGVVYPEWGWVKGFSWWGTEVYKWGCDWRACALKEVKEGERFGPGTW